MSTKIYLNILFLLTALVFSFNVYAIPVSGGSSGSFINPTGPGGMIVSGVGTNFFTWGDGSAFNSPPSSLGYTGNSFSGETDDVFSFGTLSYFNGTIAGGTEATFVDLEITLTLANPSGIMEDFLYTMALINTPNTGDANANADIINFPGTQPDTFFTVGDINYTLEFLGFGVITGSGFATIDNFSVLESRSADAEMLGRITVATTAVSEPASFILMGLGLVGLGFSCRKKVVSI